MREKVFISFLVAVALLLVCFLGLLFYISNVELKVSSPTESTAEPYTEAILYENGLMWVRDRAVISSENRAVYLPKGAILSSLRIESPDISGFGKIAPENKGITYRVESEDGVFEGRYLWDDDEFLAVESEGKTLAINKGKIKSYSYVPEPPGKDGIELFYNDSQNQSATVSYLVDGAEFSVRYVMDGSKIEAMADVSSPIGLKDARLTLRSGRPFEGAVYKESTRAVPMPASPSVVTLGREFGFYSFVIDNANLNAGSLLSLKIFEGELKTETFYYWSDSSVERRVKINNTLSNPLPAGAVNFYDNSTWVGSTYMPYAAEGEESTITVGYSNDIKVEKNLTSANITREQKTYEYTIKVTNTGPSSASAVVEQVIPKDAELISTQPRADVVGNRIKWQMPVASKESRILVYRYKVIPQS